ncbi:MAG: mandelate racemase/muconate lactonizing enzyme family protein [Bryobacteraceae bacterium]
MKIAKVESMAISIPLPSPVSDAIRLITHRDHYLVFITTDDGLTGSGFTLGYDASLAMVSMAKSIFEPILVGASVADSEKLWAEMYRQSIQAGRRGAALRAISAIDIALWDLRGQYARLPVMELCGVYARRMRCYATGGYFRPGQTLDELAAEYAGYAELGFTAAKLKVGKFSAAEDAARLGAIRNAVGESFDILLDANGGWPDAPAAIAAMRRLDEFNPYWIEEPVRADNVYAMARIAEAIRTPVATGELEATRWAFADLLHRRAASILQPDATVCGGVGEWLKIAHMASAFDVPIAPHYNWDVHTQLLAAIPNGLFIEYFVEATKVKMFDTVLANPMSAKDGHIEPRTDPGFGWRLIPSQLQRYRIG